MMGLSDLDTTLVISWFALACVWAFTVAYYNSEIEKYKGLWHDAEVYTDTLMRLYRGELVTDEEEDAKARSLDADN